MRSACCFTTSWRESSSEACFCEVASKKLLAESIESLNFARGVLILLIILSMTLSATVAARVSSVCAQRRKATARMALLASVGGLKAIVAVSRISASFEAELSSLLRTQPLFLSQDWASCAEETGLDAAEICASRLGRGEKSRAFCGDVVF